MLAIRLQRTGRKGHAQFRMIVQDSRRSPISGNVVFSLGSYDPHSKTVSIDKDKASFYLNNGAQPSPRVAYLLQKEGVKLPEWVELKSDKNRSIKNNDKLRRNKPAEAEGAAEESPSEETATETTSEATAEAPSEDQTAETNNEETPAEDTPAEESPAEEPATEEATAEEPKSE